MKEAAKTGLLLLFLFSSNLAAAETPVAGNEELKRIAGLKEPLQTEDLIRGSLIVSGVEPEKIDSYTARIDNYLKEMQSSLKVGNDDALGENVLTYLHQSRFKRYVSTQSTLDVLFEKGQFNCLSSALFYMICGRSMGLTVQLVKTTNHVLCRIKTADGWTDVETTTQFGFHPGQKREFFDDFQRRNRVTYVPATKYKDRQFLGDKEALSLIVKSRLAKDGARSDPRLLQLAINWFIRTEDKASYEELAFASTNYVKWLDQKGLTDDAMAFIENAKTQLDPTNPLEKSFRTTIYNHILFLIEKKRLEEAQTLLEANATALFPRPTRTLGEYLLSRELEEANRTRSFGDALSVAAALSQKGLLEKTVWQNYAQYLYARIAEQVSEEKGNTAAYDFLRSAPDDIEKLPSIIKSKQMYLQRGNRESKISPQSHKENRIP